MAPTTANDDARGPDDAGAGAAPGAPPAPARARVGEPGHAPSPVAAYSTLQVLGLCFPLAAGTILYGRRALATVAACGAGAALAGYCWSRIGRRGRMLQLHQVVWMATLLAALLPPHLAVIRPSALCGAPHAWAVAAGAGVLLVIILWLAGGTGFCRVQPVVLTYLVLAICFQDLLRPHAVLHRSRAVVGDLARIADRPVPAGGGADDPWIFGRADDDAEALSVRRVAAERLTAYTRGDRAPRRDWATLQGLVRDAMPPLEDLVVGGHPGPIGSSSAIMVLIGGLFLLYRGLIDYRVPLYAIFFAFVAFLLLPVPVAVQERGATWRALLLSTAPADLPAAVTFANYQLAAGPLPFAAFFLATSPSVCPMTRRGRGFYAMTFGALAAVCQLYLSVSLGPYVALLLAGLLTGPMEARARARALA